MGGKGFRLKRLAYTRARKKAVVRRIVPQDEVESNQLVSCVLRESEGLSRRIWCTDIALFRRLALCSIERQQQREGGAVALARFDLHLGPQ
jgi:hypothetical protein